MVRFRPLGSAGRPSGQTAQTAAVARMGGWCRSAGVRELNLDGFGPDFDQKSVHCRRPRACLLLSLSAAAQSLTGAAASPHHARQRCCLQGKGSSTYYCVYDADADLVARDYYKTMGVIKTLGESSVLRPASCGLRLQLPGTHVGPLPGQCH